MTKVSAGAATDNSEVMTGNESVTAPVVTTGAVRLRLEEIAGSATAYAMVVA
jgi:hypothetical protein